MDSSAIIAFYSELNMPDLLHRVIDLGYRLAIPPSVYWEINKRSTFESLKKGVDEGKIEILDRVSTDEIKKLKDRYPNLKNGELEVILWGEKLESQQKKYRCILDDGAARKVAGKKGIAFTGTLGLIKFLEKKEIINKIEAESIIGKLKQTNFRI